MFLFLQVYYFPLLLPHGIYQIIVIEYNGKVHGSQSHIVSTNVISLIVYYEIHEGKREEVKQKIQ